MSASEVASAKGARSELWASEVNESGREEADELRLHGSGVGAAQLHQLARVVAVEKQVAHQVGLVLGGPAREQGEGEPAEQAAVGLGARARDVLRGDRADVAAGADQAVLDDPEAETALLLHLLVHALEVLVAV